MNSFTFYAPTFFDFGGGKAEDAGPLVKRFGGSRVLLVYGGGSVKKNGAYQDVTASLKAAGIPWSELSGVQPNPRSGKVYEGIEIVRRDQLDFILAVGGGSAIDTAKAVGFGALYDGDFWDFYTRKAKIERTLPVGVVLTIAAAGSEGSDSCVITQEKGNLKWGCPKTDIIRPKFAILDPSYTFSLSRFQIACGSVDMLSHIMERYFTNTPNVALTDRLAEALMRTILDATHKVLIDEDDCDARADLMWAGMLAHNDSVGVGREQDWACHQIGHELSARYDCAHGVSLSVVIPAWMQYVSRKNPLRFVQFAERVLGMEVDFASAGAGAGAGAHVVALLAADDCITRLKWIFRSWGMPVSLTKIGVDKVDIPELIAHRAQRPNGFPFGKFVSIGPNEMKQILELAM